MRKIWVVIRREFVEKVRNKWFIISTVLGPLLMASFVVLPILLAEKGASERRIAVLDVGTDNFAGRLVDWLNGPVPVDATLMQVDLAELESIADSLTAAVGTKHLDGYLIVSDEAIEDGEVEYRGSNVSSMADMQVLEQVIRQAVLTERLDRAGVDPLVVAQAQGRVRMRTTNIRGGELTDESGATTFMLAYGVWLLLYM